MSLFRKTTYALSALMLISSLSSCVDRSLPCLDCNAQGSKQELVVNPWTGQRQIKWVRCSGCNGTGIEGAGRKGLFSPF